MDQGIANFHTPGESAPRITSLPVLILYPHSRCNCRCVMCDIWKVNEAQEIKASDLERHLDDIETLNVRWVVFSGGEPLMHSDLFRLSGLMRKRGIRATILTTGLLLERDAKRIVESIDDVIVSLDGPPAAHDAVRRIPNSFNRIRIGVQAIHQHDSGYPIAARTTVQQLNHTRLRETVAAAKALGLESVSFLAADLTSTAFNRPDGWGKEKQSEVGLNREQVEALEQEVESLIRDCAAEIESGFVRESPEKLRRIVRHFRAHLGQAEPEAPRCNAPWVSAVVETDGTVRPCFFHRPIGKLHTGSAGADGDLTLTEILNSAGAVAFRQSLNVAQNPICRRCVCSLHWTEES